MVNPYSASGARNPAYGANQFQNLLNSGIDLAALQQMLSKGGEYASKVKGQAAQIAGKYGPQIAGGIKKGAPLVGAGISLLQGDVGGAAGAAAGGVLGGFLGPIGAVGGSMLGGMLGSAAQSGIGNLIAGGQERQMLRGESPTGLGLGSGKSVGDMKPDEVIDFMRKSGMSQVQIAQALNPMMNQNLDKQMQRQMQLNQQLGQITGALNQQRYMAQLAGGAQAEAGATTRSMINSANPYAESVFRYN